MEAGRSTISSAVLSASRVHILGAGLNPEAPANSAVHDISEMGWIPVPIHPRDAGGSIGGYPIRPMIEHGIKPEIIVLFLAPLRARDAVRKLLLTNQGTPPLIWFQNGAEDEMSENWLHDAGWHFVKLDCIVRFMQRNGMTREPIQSPWFRQVRDEDNTGCSTWTVHEYREGCAPPESKLEWVGDLQDLETSNAIVPRYIRSLVDEGEALEACARRLAQ